MSSRVPPEILHDILKYLIEDQKHFKHNGLLYKCLFVDKFWCANVISILWRNPINLEINPKSLITTYIACLNEESKIILRENGIIIPETTKDYFTLFNYASFLKCLEFHSLYYKILFWCCNNGDLSAKLMIFKELCKMFINQSKNLKYQIKLQQTWFTDNYLSTYPHLRILSEFVPLDKDLELFECYSHIPNDVYDELSKVFTLVDKLKIICSVGEDNESLSRFIMGLKKLKYLKIQGTYMGLPIITEALRNTLKVTNYSLIKLRIHGDVLIPMEIFENCTNIKMIKITEDIPVHLNQLATIIQNINGSLETLHLNWNHEADSENGPILFKNIAQNCPKLKELYASVSILTIQIIPEVISSCHQLIHLTIILNTLDGLLDVSKDLSEILPKIGMVITSPKLKSFTLALYHLDCNINVFKEFFNYLYQNDIKNLKFNVFHRTSYKYRKEIAKEIIRKYIDLGVLHPDSVNHWMMI